jgi:hypothetical protein
MQKARLVHEAELKIAHVIRKGVERPKPKLTVVEPYTKPEVRALLVACDVSREGTQFWRTTSRALLFSPPEP